MKVLVAGAGGYIGIPLCQSLLDKGHQVVALDRYFFGKDKMAPVATKSPLTILIDDIRSFDPKRLEGIEAVVDLAGLSNDLSAEIDPDITHSINCSGAMRLARLSKEAGVRRYVYASSASVYGHGTSDSLCEESECRPLSLYAQYKLCIEQFLAELASPSFETVIFRNSTVFGLAPRMRFDLAVNVMTMRAWKDRVIEVNGNGEQWRPFVHVKDVVRALLLGLEQPASAVANEIFNVGSSKMNFQIGHLAELIARAIPRTKLRRVPENVDARTYNVSFAKIENRLKFKPAIPILSGVLEIKHALERKTVLPNDPTCYTLQWYRTLLTWDSRIKEVAMDGRII